MKTDDLIYWNGEYVEPIILHAVPEVDLELPLPYVWHWRRTIKSWDDVGCSRRKFARSVNVLNDKRLIVLSAFGEKFKIAEDIHKEIFNHDEDMKMVTNYLAKKKGDVTFPDRQITNIKHVQHYILFVEARMALRERFGYRWN